MSSAALFFFSAHSPTQSCPQSNTRRGEEAASGISLPRRGGPGVGHMWGSLASVELWRLTQSPHPESAGCLWTVGLFWKRVSTPQLLNSSGGESFWAGGLGGNENSPGEKRGEFCTVICYGKKEKTGTGGEWGNHVRGGEGVRGDDSVCATVYFCVRVCSGGKLVPPNINETEREGHEVERYRETNSGRERQHCVCQQTLQLMDKHTHSHCFLPLTSFSSRYELAVLSSCNCSRILSPSFVCFCTCVFMCAHAHPRV